MNKRKKSIWQVWQEEREGRNVVIIISKKQKKCLKACVANLIYVVSVSFLCAISKYLTKAIQWRKECFDSQINKMWSVMVGNTGMQEAS